MSAWEHHYRDAVAEIVSPDCLDEKILQQARRYKPPKKDHRWLSRAASSCAALAVVVLLAHPAQYLGALTPNGHAVDTQSDHMAKWRRSSDRLLEKTDSWYALRSEVKAGNYVNLCNQWRRQQRSSALEKLPRDLEASARSHCRLLPTP